MRGRVEGKPLATIVEELNNVLTVVAMCADELEASSDGASEPMADMRSAIRRGAELTRMLHELTAPISEPRLVDSDVRPTPDGARRR